MADLSDVTTYLAAAVASAVYPNGASQPSAAAVDCRIYEGWPLPDKLDRDMAGLNDDGSVRAGGAVSNVSVYPMQGTGVEVYQILDETYTIVPVSYGMVPSVAGNVITIAGQPKAGEYLTLICDGNLVFSQTGASTVALLAALLAAVQVNYPSASATSNTLTVPVGHSMVVRQGGVATLGKVTHRQKHSVMVTVWAPNKTVRALLGAAIDNSLKQTLKIALPDTSQAIVRYNWTNVSDDQQSTGIYRRDLIYEVEYATVQQFPGYVVTSVNTQITTIGAITNAQVNAVI